MKKMSLVAILLSSWRHAMGVLVDTAELYRLRRMEELRWASSRYRSCRDSLPRICGKVIRGNYLRFGRWAPRELRFGRYCARAV